MDAVTPCDTGRAHMLVGFLTSMFTVVVNDPQIHLKEPPLLHCTRACRKPGGSFLTRGLSTRPAKDTGTFNILGAARYPFS